MTKFKVNFNCWGDPEFNIRVVIPVELKNMWERKEVLYNINAPGDPLGFEELFVDNNNLFISTDKARASHKFMDKDKVLFDENYEGVPSEIYLTYEGEFDDEFQYISSENEYFEDPYREEWDCNFNQNFPGMWRLDWYGADQDEFDVDFRDDNEEYPEDSWYNDHDEDDGWDEDEDDDWDEDEDDFEESTKKSKFQLKEASETALRKLPGNLKTE